MNLYKTTFNNFYSWLTYLVFFIVTLIYFGFFTDYILFYQEKSSLFIFTSEFLLENLHQPGGLLIYMGKFLSTFFYSPPAGALIVSAVITLVIFTISKIIFFLSGESAMIVPFLIGVLLFFLQTNYDFLLFNNLGLLLQLTLFCLTLRYLNGIKGWIPVAIVPLWYFATGSFSLIFSLLLTFYFVFDKEKKGWAKLIAVWGLNLLTIYISKEFLFFQSEGTLLTFPFMELNTGSQTTLFLSITAILSLLPVIARFRIRLPGKMRISEQSRVLITTTIVIIVLFIIGIERFDIKNKKYFRVENLFYQQKYDEVISYNTSNPPTNSLTIFLNNIALCETDKLNDLLFHFPQSPDGNTLFLKWEMIGEILKRGGYFYYTIGMINEAHRWAFENMVMKGHSPEGLKMLIRTELINGNYKVASSYINILKRTLYYRKEALAFEKILYNDAAIISDPDLGEKRKNKLDSDFFSITDDPFINIERILATDSLNKKAFEYKVAFLLLKKDYNGIESKLPEFSKLGYTHFPVHIEEAISALEVLKNGTSPYLGNIQPGIETQNRWIQYLTVLQKYGNDIKTAEPALRKQFGNTFWYWVFYR